MKRTKSVLLLMCISVSSLFAKGQTTDTTKGPMTDIVKVPVMYVTDSVKFTTATAYVNKITTYELQFLQQQAPAGVDSFIVKKTRVPVKAEYYLIQPLTTTYPKYKPLWILFEFKRP